MYNLIPKSQFASQPADIHVLYVLITDGFMRITGTVCHLLTGLCMIHIEKTRTSSFVIKEEVKM